MCFVWTEVLDLDELAHWPVFLETTFISSASTDLNIQHVFWEPAKRSELLHSKPTLAFSSLDPRKRELWMMWSHFTHAESVRSATGFPNSVFGEQIKVFGCFGLNFIQKCAGTRSTYCPPKTVSNWSQIRAQQTGERGVGSGGPLNALLKILNSFSFVKRFPSMTALKHWTKCLHSNSLSMSMHSW